MAAAEPGAACAATAPTADAPLWNAHPARAKVTARFEGVLAADADDPGTAARLAARLEVHLHNWTVRTCKRDGIPCYWECPAYRYRYTTRALSLEWNLRNPGNPGLRERILANDLSLKTFANMTPVEMWPERWEESFQRVAMRQLRREADVDASKAPDGAYTCGRCKSRKTAYTSMQIRSADEPMTTFVRCLNCGKSWKD